MKGRLLLFDTLDKTGLFFPKNCELTYPEKVPVIREFSYDDPDAVLGSATVSKDEKGLVCNVELTNFDRDILRNEFNDEIYIGGYYDAVDSLYADDRRIITKAALLGVSTVFASAHEEMKMKVEKEE